MKSALERKEAEMEQLKSGSICRAVQDAQKIRAVSPLRLQRYGTTSNLKAEIIPRPVDDTRNTEVSHKNSINFYFPSDCLESWNCLPSNSLLISH